MSENPVIIEIIFFGLLAFSVLMPIGIYAYMMWKQSISRPIVVTLGLALLVISAIDLFLLRHLAGMSERSLSAIHGSFFASEFSVALYVLPLLSAGLGVNVISHVLIRHLMEAETKFDREHQ
jgi:hypothetical protein